MDETTGAPDIETARPATDQPNLDRVFAQAMGQVATAGAGTATRAGQLRLKLVETLGDQHASALRARVHRVAVAAEEHVPATLTALAPLSAAAAGRIAAELAARRGWTHAAAVATVDDWATALGLTPYAASPAPPPDRDSGDRGPRPRSVPSPSPPHRVSSPATPSWPPMKGRTRYLLGLTGLPADGAAHAYAGMPLRLFWSLVAGLVVLAVGAGLLVPSSTPGKANIVVSGCSALLAVALSTRLRRGLLLATADGLTFVPFDRRMAKPTGEPATRVTWPFVVVVRPGSDARGISGRVLLRGLRIDVGPEGRQLLRAVKEVSP